MNTPVLPERMLRLMKPADRAKLGRAGMLADEAREIAAARSEKELQNQIEAMLRREGIFTIRQRMDRKSNVTVGTPDILFAVAGMPAAWEIKLPGRHPTDAQREAMTQMAANGWRCAVVRSYDEARGLLIALEAEGHTLRQPCRAVGGPAQDQSFLRAARQR